jgi:diguanylate cyclase (GGDEF)-like protein
MRTLARAQRQTAEAYALATLLRRGAEMGNDEELYRLVSNTAVRLLGADLAGLVLGSPLHDGSAWRGVVGNRTQQWRGRHYGPNHRAAATIFSGTTQVVRAPDGGAFDVGEFPFFGAEGIVVGVSVPLDRSNAARGALCLGWRFEVEMAAGQLELIEALAAFSGSMVVAAATRAERDAIIANAPVIVVTLDAERNVTLCEGAAAAAIGLGPEQVGHAIAELLPDASELLTAIDSVATGNDPTRTELTVRGRALDVAVEVRDGGTFLIGTDITERCDAERELRRRATEDELTGLPNQTEVVRRIAEVLAYEPVCAVVADVRNFDQVNAAIGYGASDELLRTLGTRLAADISDAIVVGRIGGDEFAVAGRAADCSLLAERVRRSLERYVAGGTESTLAVDVRCGSAESLAGSDAQTLLRHADSALQIARSGAEAMVVWDAEVAARRKPQLALAQQLRRALEERSFALVYQPIVDAHTGAVRRVEALARWPAGLEPSVGPDVFVPLAERLGRIGQLTEHVLDAALAQVAVEYSVPVGVNVSPLDVVHGDLPKLVGDLLKAHGLEPELLTLELTEHAALEAKTDALEALVALGVSLSVDDFGRGWSSLEMLRMVPGRELKLDRSYVQRVVEDITNEAIVRAAVEVGHAFGMQVVAEGIESEAVLEAIRRLGCDLAQGYHVARPMNADALGEWLGRLPGR